MLPSHHILLQKNALPTAWQLPQSPLVGFQPSPAHTILLQIPPRSIPYFSLQSPDGTHVILPKTRMANPFQSISQPRLVSITPFKDCLERLPGHMRALWENVMIA